jgi:nicotinate-nucleotide adenylyltransferase
MDDATRIGLFGGSFNPPHLGHLVVASDICAQLGLARVVFMPAAMPPHKVIEDDVPATTRLAMTKLAIAGDQRFTASALEVDEGFRYTVETVTEFHARNADAEIFFIVGSDSLLQFEHWHQPEAILAICRLAVAPRPGDEAQAIKAAAEQWGRGAVSVLPTTAVDISSSEIRGRLRLGMPITYLVPATVEAFIDEHGLYVHP